MERGLTPAPAGEHGENKTEEFERFMATSIRAFDAMMDAVKGSGDAPPPAPIANAPSPPSAFATPNGQLPPNLSELADTNSVAIVGNEYMVSQVTP